MQWENAEPLTDPTQYLLPNDGKPGPCWHHPGARAAAMRFMETVGQQIGRYDNILVWNVWQEVAPESQMGSHLGLCYCANTLAAFQSWLQRKFASLDALNRSWRTAYAEWDETDPPRRFNKVPLWIDWRYFMEDVYLADRLKFQSGPTPPTAETVGTTERHGDHAPQSGTPEMPPPSGGHTAADRESRLESLRKRRSEIETRMKELLGVGPIPNNPDHAEGDGEKNPRQAFASDLAYRQAVVDFERDAGRFAEAKDAQDSRATILTASIRHSMTP